ncbi:hypothetical protein C5142_02260 [Rhodococcus sp. BGS-1C]|jgi:hypothetical protein|uniref:hypothetical protein n=1 Tax=unclassified Rhodococcus (in: high G+C Gram-positive bacteria) TaxID=192944 RepID=UPI0019D0C99F|nr:hypothetical protein [Rhodococcus sp. KRD197]
MNAVQSMLVTAPDTSRAQLRSYSATALLDARLALEVDPARLTDPTNATKNRVALPGATNSSTAFGRKRTQEILDEAC